MKKLSINTSVILSTGMPEEMVLTQTNVIWTSAIKGFRDDMEDLPSIPEILNPTHRKLWQLS